VCVEVAKDIVNILTKNPMSCAIVDPEKEYSEYLSNVLYDLGFDMSVFNNEKDFNSVCCKSNFDIVIVSWDMETFLGEDVVESLRKCGEPYPSIIVGCDGGNSVSFQLALSPVGFLFKPFEAKRLFEVVRRAMENNK
jgi:FixJ family two-component response regulator